jgi:hypothetical protein
VRPVELGQTLSTTTTVLGLKDSAPKGDQFRGKVWLGIVTSSEDGPVVEYERCALVRGRTVATQPGQRRHPGPVRPEPARRSRRRRARVGPVGLPRPTGPWATRVDPLRDHVDLAAPFARITFNQAAVHRDVTMTANGRRLVYGGHVQGSRRRRSRGCCRAS